MSKINLPELPNSPGSIYFEGDGLEPGELVDMYSGIQMRAYAEQAVREALAALAKALSAQADIQRLNYQSYGCNPYHEGIADGLDVAEQKALALIPENIPGHKPGPVDASSVHSVAPQASEAVPTEPLRVFSAGMWTYDGTGQAFSHTELDEAAFVTYRAALSAKPKEPPCSPTSDSGHPT